VNLRQRDVQQARAASAILLGGAWIAACAGRSDTADGERVGQVSEAVDVCSETVPANRNVDGIPAYAQCAATENSAIYSDNGVDTSTMSMGSGWVRTQYNGGYQCTEFAYRYLHFRWNIVWEPNGNAGTWCDSTPPSGSGVVQTSTPSHGDLIVFAPGSCGADPTAGHVAVVDVVNGTTSVTAVEQNSAGRDNYKQTCAKCFLHAVANTGADGSSPSAGADASLSSSADAMTGAAPVMDSMAPDEAATSHPPPSGVTPGDDGGSLASSSSDAALPNDAVSASDADPTSDMPSSWGSETASSKGCTISRGRSRSGSGRGLVVLLGIALAGGFVRSRRARARGRAS
jgi:surface antigen